MSASFAPVPRPMSASFAPTTRPLSASFAPTTRPMSAALSTRPMSASPSPRPLSASFCPAPRPSSSLSACLTSRPSSAQNGSGWDGCRVVKKVLKANTVDFARREKEEMRELTRASEVFTWFPAGEAEGGGAGESYGRALDPSVNASSTATYWDPLLGQVFLGNTSDVPGSPDAHAPSSQIPAHKADEEEDQDLFDCAMNDPRDGYGYDICVQCHEVAPFPTAVHLRAAEEHVSALEGMWAERAGREGRVRPPPNVNAMIHLPFPACPPATAVSVGAVMPFLGFLETCLRPNPAGWSRPLKILVHSADGYTESSVLALCLVMYLRRVTLPEAYLEMQVGKRRSFFCYQGDLALLRRVEGRCVKDREGEGAGRSAAVMVRGALSIEVPGGHGHGRGASESESQSAPALSSSSPQLAMMAPWHSRVSGAGAGAGAGAGRRPRASTSPALPTFVPSHETWFSDPRFDGSFPSRVLPFLYLGNLNHATNAYMLHALGITHVVSVGECALVPPPSFAGHGPVPADKGAPGTPGKRGEGHGSLWIEEREGRIKVLDIKGVCDDGIDTLAPQLEPICEWIERARAGGGQVLVHCRVGVSRSATVTIAYVMKHLGVPLVDAYLIVRSRRLSVLIQPNMRLLYNLLGWEVRLARERAGEDEERLRGELARCVNWPYLAREVHRLNEKYLR
ncbi:hypothetical protein OE88DRAFT_1755506 [Heliocybe sulcata]|uniref:Uncharacterized protein n=1 Tax=Heliocybe sulcata TaxID=5364 RepID=A0A5C3N120_9AGAM|nr:hypothetical protein OE88DRAFT_1755506 [Heliocybe sulcata]